MIHQPRFKSSFHIEIVEPEGVFLLAENQYFLLKGPLYQQLAPLIDGKRTIDELADCLQAKASMADVYYALMLMEKKGYLVENNEQLPPAVCAFYETLNVNIADVVQQLQNTPVLVSAVGAVTTDPLISALQALNIQVQAEKLADQIPLNPSFSPVFEVVLTDDYLQPALEAINQRALQYQRPWMLVKPVGTMIWIGPIFQPGQTGCWKCLAQRLQANRPVDRFIQKRQAHSTPFPTSIATLPSTLQTAIQLAATEIAKWIIQPHTHTKLVGQLLTFDTVSLETQSHSLTHRPQCPSCGDPSCSIPTKSVVLDSRQKTFTADGGHRYLPPEETLKAYEHLISPITGVVRGLKSLSLTTQGPTHIYIAGHNSAAIFDELFFLRQNIRGRSSGKGKTDIQAKASAFCEAIERYSGLFQGDEIRQSGTYHTLGTNAIHPNLCLNFSEKQYQNRHKHPKNTLHFRKVPEPFDDTKTIEWTPIWSLTAQTVKYLPTAYCYYGYPNSPTIGCWADSNGASAGNTKEEAILQGFMELVERDSVALWWYNRIQRTEVELESFDDPYIQTLKAYYQSLHREFWVLDITNDFHIPTFAAISRRTDTETEDIILGFGTHFDINIALFRALTEMNQMLSSVSYQASDGSTHYVSDDAFALNWWKIATLDNQSYLRPDNTKNLITASDYPQTWHNDLRDDVMACVTSAEQQGLEVLVLDQTRPDIGLNVVKVFVPGLRNIWNRLGPGRLYEVPVKMGWLPKALTEDQLNPMPVFF